MLFLLLLFFSNCVVITGDEKVPAKFNEEDLIEKQHQQVLKVNAYIDGIHQRINKKQQNDTQTTYRPTAVTHTFTDDEFLDYHITNIWWTTGMGDRTHETTFLPTPFGHNRIPTGYTRPRETTVPTNPSSTHTFPTSTSKPSLPYKIPTHFTKDQPHIDFSLSPTTHDYYYDLTIPAVVLSTESNPIEVTTPPTTLATASKFSTLSFGDYPHIDFSITPTPMHPEYPDTTRTYSINVDLLPVNDIITPLPTFVLESFEDSTSESATTVAGNQEVTSPILSDIVKDWVKKRTKHSPHAIAYPAPIDMSPVPGRPAHPADTTSDEITLPEPSSPKLPYGHAMFGKVTPASPTTTTTIAYQHMMNALREGYLVVFLVELMALVALKETNHVHDVISHSDAIVSFHVQNGYFYWLDWPLSQAIQDLSKYISTNETDVIQSHAKILYRILLERREALSDEVNAIIDYAQTLYAPWEGKHLFNAIRGFGDYPTTEPDGYWTCNNLFESFLLPFKRIGDVNRRKKLVVMVNKALMARFPQYSKDERRFHGGTDKFYEEQAHSTPKDPPEDSIRPPIVRRSIRTSEIPKRSNRHKATHRKTNLNPTTQSRKHKNRRQYHPRTEYEFPILRKLKPITASSTIQRRYHIVTSNYHFRQMNLKPTTRFYINLMTRPTKAITNTYKKTYITEDPIVNKFNYKRQMSNGDEHAEEKAVEDMKGKALFYHLMKERFKELYKAKSGKLKAEMLRKIVDGSSYSDEEADLKMKLIQALLLKNGSVEVTSGHTK